VVEYKIKIIIKMDKTVDVEDGVSGAAAPLNIIPKKSASSPLVPGLPV
jgi:hypothetical protein